MISESTIGRMIKDLKKRGLIIEDVKVSFNGRSGKIRIIKKSNKRRKGEKDINRRKQGI
jgi:uncharacterized membrane protein